MCNCIKITLFFLSAIKSANAWPHTSSGPVWKLRIDQIIDMHGDFWLVFTAPAKLEVELRAKIGHYRNRSFCYYRKATDAKSSAKS